MWLQAGKEGRLEQGRETPPREEGGCVGRRRGVREEGKAGRILRIREMAEVLGGQWREASSTPQGGELRRKTARVDIRGETARVGGRGRV